MVTLTPLLLCISSCLYQKYIFCSNLWTIALLQCTYCISFHNLLRKYKILKNVTSSISKNRPKILAVLAPTIKENLQNPGGTEKNDPREQRC